MVESSFFRYRCLGSRESRVLDARFLGLVLSCFIGGLCGSAFWEFTCSGLVVSGWGCRGRFEGSDEAGKV